MKRTTKLVVIGIIFLLLLQVQASGEEQLKLSKYVVWGNSFTNNSENVIVEKDLSNKTVPKAETKGNEQKTTQTYPKPQTVAPVAPPGESATAPADPVEKESGGDVQDVSEMSLSELKKEFSGTLFYSGSSESKKIALTFDDGPSEISCNQALDVLEKFDIKATFFLLGQKVHKYPHVVKRIVQEGHTVAGHSWSHVKMDRISPEALEKEIDNTENEIFQLIGVRIGLFRPPYGAVTGDGLNCLEQKGYKVINWSVDSRDWEYPHNINQIRNNILNNIKGGAIILFHTMGGKEPSQVIGTLLPEIILTLQDKGYQFVTVDELLSLPPYK